MINDGSRDQRVALAARRSGGDRRSIGAAGEVANETLGYPSRAPVLIDLLRHPDPIVRMRAADALEKASRQRPDLLGPHVDAPIAEIGSIAQQEVRWHIAQVIPRLPLDALRRAGAVALLRGYLGDGSRIVVVDALTALAALAQVEPVLCAWLTPELQRSVGRGPPSMRARARRLLSDLHGKTMSDEV